ncbi:uncharacterized protein PAC_16930 [Phialocephala subalpina]|uniref:Uncharacterized protein n=1 Tax=Phialocephala subalpina TaxID=576137 RepID=A0A1L7XPQ3_9HELO|nr:uncharacterized protein PAC_16930 [Phialocephala subalpina]
MAEPFPREAMQRYLHETSLPLENPDLESNTWSILLETTDGPELAMNIVSHGMLDADDAKQAASLNGLIRSNFTTELKVKKGTSPLISNATLAAGHVHCLLSAVSASRTLVRGMEVSNHLEDNTLGIGFKCMVFLRLGEIVGATMADILSNQISRTKDESSNCYSAAAFLLHEANCLYTSLRTGALHHMMFPDKLFRGLLAWSKSLERQLAPVVRDGCHKYLDWQASLDGSKKHFKDHHRDDLLKITIDLQQNIRFSENYVWRATVPEVIFDEICEISSAPTSRPSETPPYVPPATDAGTFQATGLEEVMSSGNAWSEAPNPNPQQSMAIANDAVEQIVPGSFDSVDFNPPFDYNANIYLDPEYVDSNDWNIDPGLSFTWL